MVNNPYSYDYSIDESTGEIIQDYSENREMFFDEAISVLGNMRVSQTRLGESSYETRKLIVPAKGKNFTIKILGESKDALGIESLGFVFKLGKVKER